MATTITVGLDIAKNVFYALAIGQKSKEQWRRKLSRRQVLSFFANLEQCCIALEACGSSHYWARELLKLGHRVELLPPQHVKGYLRGQKNDYNDARAIAEASQHGAVRPVPIKTAMQQEQQAFHRIRASLVKTQTGIVNQMRGLLAEHGIIIGKAKGQFRRAIPLILEDADNGLGELLRMLLQRQYQRFCDLEEELSWYEQEIQAQAKQDEAVQQLMTIRGFGPVNSSVFKSWVGDGQQFTKGRHASAALGLVPGQYGTGGRVKLLGITKRGDSQVRTALIHGARAVVRLAAGRTDPLSQWINRLVATRGFNKAVVAYANKMARIGWALIAKGNAYDPTKSAQQFITAPVV
jgi:transposase